MVNRCTFAGITVQQRVLCEKYDNIMASRRSRDVFCGVTHKLKFDTERDMAA